MTVDVILHHSANLGWVNFSLLKETYHQLSAVLR